MELDRIAIALRRRNAWQAVDLGFSVARRWWLVLWIAWALPALLLFLPLSLLLPHEHVWLAGALVWWLKPLWDGAPLFIASRRLFGEEVGLREAWRQTPRLFGRELLLWLTFRRLSLTRSADLPVTLLERLRGAERRRRLRVLHPGMGNAAGWLTAGCVHFEWILILGVWGLVALMLPEEADFDAVGFFFQGSALAAHIYNLLTFLAMSVVAPAYTMAGFMLYVCRRVELEGWDIEIRFRALAARARAPAAGTALAATLVFAATLALALPDTALAQAAAPGAEIRVDRGAAAARIERVLEGPEFHDRVEVRRLRPKGDDSAEEHEAPGWLKRLREWLRSLGWGERESDRSGVGFAEVVELLLWLAAGGLVAFVVYKFRHVLPRLAGPRPLPAPARPQVLFGLDLRPASLPTDVPASVDELWRTGQRRAALGLLYRATLARMLTDHALPFADHHTEGECAELVRAHCPQLAGFFGELTAVWQQLAYAHREPVEARFTQLCLRWQEAFGHDA